MERLQTELPQEAAQTSTWVANGGWHLCPFGGDAIGLGLRENPGASVNEPSNCAKNRERRYRRSRFLVKRSPSCHVLRGNRGASVPTVGDSGAARRSLYRRSPIPARPGARFTDAPRFPRGPAPALPTLPDSGAAHTIPPPHEKQPNPTAGGSVGHPPLPARYNV